MFGNVLYSYLIILLWYDDDEQLILKRIRAKYNNITNIIKTQVSPSNNFANYSGS